MAYPTTLALITALWSGPARTHSIAMWSALGGGVAMLGPLISGLLLEYFAWGSVFIITVPLAVLALYMANRNVPAHVSESDGAGRQPRRRPVRGDDRVADHRPELHHRAQPADRWRSGCSRWRWSGVVLFVIRQRRAANPLYDLKVAARRTFWVAACAGIIVFGSLMGVAFINQQYLQNVLGFSTLQAGAAILPAVVFMVIVAPRSAKLVQERGSRFTLLLGQSILALAFVGMLLLWGEGTSYLFVAIPLALMGSASGSRGRRPRTRSRARSRFAAWAWRRARRTSSATSVAPS